MAIVLVYDKVSEEDFEKAREDYESYIKITLDLKKEIVALGVNTTLMPSSYFWRRVQNKRIFGVEG